MILSSLRRAVDADVTPATESAELALQLPDTALPDLDELMAEATHWGLAVRPAPTALLAVSIALAEFARRPLACNCDQVCPQTS